jgi:F-type H+-transporting ATPase subunit delta
MTDTKVAKRYAKSLLNLADEQKVMDAVNDDMKMFIDVADHSRDFKMLLSNPIIDSTKKLNILTQLFSGKMNKMTISFFNIVTRKKRENYLYEIAKAYASQYKTLKGIQTAEVISAIGLDDNLRKQVYDLIRKGSNEQIELVEKVDKSLIGGFVLRIGDKQYDASVASDIRKLARTFTDNSYVSRN